MLSRSYRRQLPFGLGRRLLSTLSYFVYSTAILFAAALPLSAGAAEVIVDNNAVGAQDASRTFTGKWCKSSGTNPYGGTSLYSCGTGKDTYRWTPTIAAAGKYSVYLWWSTHANRSATVPITISTGTATDTKTVNQKVNGGQWNLLGTYDFKAGTTGFVELSDAGGLALADAVRLVSGATPPNTSERDAARLLTQATYGPTLTSIASVATKGPATWIDEQFLLTTTSYYDTIKTLVTTPDTDPFQWFQEAIWKQAINGTSQLRQRVGFALSEIFVVSQRDGDLNNAPLALASYFDMLNRNAFGNFRKLMEDVTLHQAMGLYLDMMTSDKEDAASGRMPNENFPRELLQLFTIGLEQLNQDGTVKLGTGGKPIPTYDQDVILGFAKAFSGWSWGTNPKTDDGFRYGPYPLPVNFWRTNMQSFPTHHSTGTKLLLNGVTLPGGQTPEKDLADALDNIFNHPNVGPFLAKQLIQRLVTSNPSPAYVSRVAGAFNNNGAGVRGDMKAVIKAILLDNEARSLTVAAGNTFGKLREPVIRVANLARAFNAKSPSGQYGFWYLESSEYGVGQAHMRSPSVFNFFHPDYSPEGAFTTAKLFAPEFEIATDTTIITSTDVLFSLVFYSWGGGTRETKLDYASFIPLAGDAAKLIDKLGLVMCAGNLSPTTRGAAIDAVNAIPAAETANRVKNAVYILAASPDFAIQR